MTEEVKNIKQLIELLSKYPNDTKILVITEGQTLPIYGFEYDGKKETLFLEVN